MKKITILILSLFIQAIDAQWTNDYSQNTPLATYQTSVPQSISTSDGSTFVSFWKVTGSSDNYQLYVQLLDKDGNKKFGTDGLLVRSDTNISTFTVQYSTTVDKDNNLYISFTETDGTGRSFVHKISTAGTQLWGNDGLILPTGTYDAKVFTDPNSSNVYVTYMSGNNSFIGKYDANKQMLWPSLQTVAIPSASYTSTTVGEGGVLSDGSFVALIHARASVAQPDSNFYAQRYDSSTGNAMWSAMTKLTTRTTAFNTRYNTITDGDVVYLGFTGASSTRFDSFLQRVNADGTLPWGNNGKDFSTTNTYYEMNTKIAMQAGSSNIWAISRFTTSSQGSSGTYVQKFDKNTGNRLLTDGAKELFSVTSNNKAQLANLRMANEKPVFISINADYNGANSTPISISALNDDGSFYFSNQLIDIVTSDTAKGYITFTGGTDNNFVAVWQEERNGGDYSFAQNYDLDNYLSVDNLSAKRNIAMYPNPVSSYLNINSENNIAEVKVFNIAGQILKTTKSDKIDFTEFAKGVYIVSVKDSKGNINTQKIIKN
ncbi:T9SS type A sorting domain-containing protein [Epilithonimonas mollis]|uniref:Por secretion system C-terminal sorting domain-containing protein n=1 Tax=Epilithonimonas mollis TaxID=216903 RepID=A0A1M6RPS8_9FLAO|nr:T9SS type A sorting domain-containing protein [Epilithonimonas mollis]SHK34400.1 Por secretion system C-terminal sorting domain-containing protein [Epilithonimonas mollis]